MDVSKYPIIYCIYNADGTFLGELKYMVNKYLYGLKCSMCEITHNTFTKKKQWISKISGLNVNLKTVHLDEQKRDLFEFSKGKTPCVVKETEKGFSLIFSDDDLNKFNGDVEFFMNSLKNKISNGH